MLEVKYYYTFQTVLHRIHRSHRFGDAPFLGSLGGHPPAAPVAGTSVTPGGDGYYAIDQAGNVYAFGEAPNLGGAACKTTTPPSTG